MKPSKTEHIGLGGLVKVGKVGDNQYRKGLTMRSYSSE